MPCSPFPHHLLIFCAIYIMLYYFSSIFNPLIYAVRMQEFRKAVRNLVFTKTLQLTRVQPNEQQLHNMFILTKYLLK